MNHDERIEQIEKLMDNTIEKNPHCKEIVSAFRPVILERYLLVDKVELKNTDAPKIDKRKFKGGVPVIRQTTLFRDDDPLAEIALSLIPAMKRGFPNLLDDLERLEGIIKKENINIYDYFKSYPADGDTIVAGWASEFNINAAAVALLLRIIMRIILEKRSQLIEWKWGNWEKGYCPVCGTFPSIAMIKEKIAERWLHCSQCGYEWKFSRVICPYCEDKAYKEMPFFFVEDKGNDCAFACDKCKRYLITLTRMSDLIVRDLDISAISLTHLDIIMQEKGFQPMAVCEWNVF
ncbi:MAG: formate dehydrogenase accessory protein FdhE [Deltaproteobacteria bacterium]|nr:formate dehydrogenase accessory protein FdhE [Deltaproteobacteria bacterium]